MKTHNNAGKTVTLTRNQIERLAVALSLTQNIQSVTITQGHETGIGASHWVQFDTNRQERDWQEEITDVSAW